MTHVRFRASVGLVEVDQEIDVTLPSSLSARHRTEQVERAHPEGGELGTSPGKAQVDVVARRGR
jgi:hypothetical protein